ncbi:MAG: hypothetical protein ACK47B_00135 [Armatimonadota bacterium]
MPMRTFAKIILATSLVMANLAAAEPLPAPEEPLKDYNAKGYVQVDLPPLSEPMPGPDGTKIVDTGVRLWFPFHQAYVRPDRMMLDLIVQSRRQRMLVQGGTERVYTPQNGIVVETVYRNLDAARENPITAHRMSMAAFSRALQEITAGKQLPAEDLEAMEKANKARIEELQKLRKTLAEKKSTEVTLEFERASAEMARLRDDIEQIPLRKKFPYVVMEYDNKDLLPTLLTRGLMGDRSTELLDKGKTRVWITKAHGMPFKLETMGNDGRVAIYLSIIEMEVNSGMLPGELVLGAPGATQQVSVTVDMKDPNWEERRDTSLEEQFKKIEHDRVARENDYRKQLLQNRGGGKPTTKKKK